MVTAQRIRVLLVDDHRMFRQGLRSLLQSYPDIDVVDEAGDAAVLADEGLGCAGLAVVLELKIYLRFHHRLLDRLAVLLRRRVRPALEIAAGSR